MKTLLISKNTINSIANRASAEADVLTNEAYPVKGWAAGLFGAEMYVQELENLLRVSGIPQKMWKAFPWHGKLPWYVM